ncbi:MAG: hypothetical protein U0441_19635 [Polyangiaceae bacterium]
MSDENENEPEADKPAAEDPEPASRPPRVDEDGLPLDRAPTLDDVRSKDGIHGRFAMGCTIAIVALIVAFWLIRGGLGG